MDRLSKQRLRVLLLIFLGFYIGLFIRIVYIQFHHPRHFGLHAKKQSKLTMEIPPLRGKILDRNGHPLALDIQVDSLGVNPHKVENVNVLGEHLHRILKIPYSFLDDRLNRDKEFVWIARKLGEKESRAVKALEIGGLEIRKEWQRFYPNGAAAAHVLGFTGLDHHGLEGLEYLYDSYLKGVPGWKSTKRDAKQRELVAREVEWMLPVNGYNIHLTIDVIIQHLADKLLAETCRIHQAESGSVVVVEPDSGDILAMANYPSFDPNDPSSSKTDYRRNRAITDIHEPGSVFKAITLAGILNEGKGTLEDKIYCERGEYFVGGRVLHDSHPYEELTLEDVIAYSSNIGTAKAASRLSPQQLYENILKFGFWEKTGVTLPGEVRGMVPHPKAWSRPTLSSIAIGHEVAVTTLQLALSYTALANDGVKVMPRIVTKIQSEDHRIIRQFNEGRKKRVVSKQTARQVRKALIKVVEHGTGKRAKVPGAVVGGKTGTAQKLEPDGSYSHDHFIASFVGFIEREGVKVVIAVSVNDPKPVYYGGSVAAPLFSKVADGILSYWLMDHL